MPQFSLDKYHSPGDVETDTYTKKENTHFYQLV